MKINTKLLSVFSPLIFVVSCANTPNFDFRQTTIWENLTKDNYEDVTVTKWRDGDTLEFRRENGANASLRIGFIDTPETHKKQGKDWVDTEGLEYEWGTKASNFAAKQIPLETKIRIVFFGGKSYDREVGAVFYGENFGKNYSLSIIQEGLAVPHYSGNNLLSISEKRNINHYIAYPLAETFNYAFDNQIGIYKNDLYKKIYSTRGEPNFDQFLKSKSKEGTNIYSWIDNDYWK